MQLNQTHDRANRLSFKGALAHKVEAALSAPAPETETPNQILLLPSNFQELSETDLHFTLMHNKELKHSRETANLATEIVFGKRLHPKTVQFQTVELANPAALPQFVKKQTKPKRSPAKKILADDSTAVRMQAEKAKEAEFKAYIDSFSTRTKTEPEAPKGTILRVPKNYNDFSEAELFHVLTYTTELEHSRTSAYLAMDILSGKVAKPENVTLQSIDLPKIVPTTPTPVKAKEVIPSHVIEAEREKREQFKANLANKAAVTTGIIDLDSNFSVPEIELRIPAHYKELSEAGLFYTLTHNPELQHSHETASLATNIIFKKIAKPESVKFTAIDLTQKVEPEVQELSTAPDPLDGFIPEREKAKRAELKAYLAGQTERILASAGVVEVEKEIILRLPKNYKELSQDELLYVLTRSPELQHSMDSAYLTLDLMAGKIKMSPNVKFHSVEIKPIVEESSTPVAKTPRETSIHPEVKAADRPKRELFKEEIADRARAAFNAKPVFVEDKPLRVILLPEGYETMSPGELHFALVRNPELKHSQESARYAVDILEGKIKNAPVEFSVIALENPELAPVTLPKAVKPKAFNTEKKSSVIINRPALLTRAQIPVTDSPAPDARVLKIPHNYEEMNETQLHFALSHNREYGHSYESTYETLDILYGRTQCPEGTVFSTIEVEKPVERAY